jgi:hypothetical protein
MVRMSSTVCLRKFVFVFKQKLVTLPWYGGLICVFMGWPLKFSFSAFCPIHILSVPFLLPTLCLLYELRLHVDMNHASFLTTTSSSSLPFDVSAASDVCIFVCKQRDEGQVYTYYCTCMQVWVQSLNRNEVGSLFAQMA